MKASDPKYGGASRPKIEQDDIEDGDAVVVTIEDVEEEKVKGDRGDKVLLVLITREFGDKVHRLNTTQRDYLIEKLGDETDRWIGKRVPLVKQTVEFQKKKYPTVYVAAPEEWDDLLAGEEAPPARRPRTVAKAKGKRGK